MTDGTTLRAAVDTLAQELGDRLDVLDPTRARRMIEARLFPGATPPAKVGRFELREMLGAGGMGVVYAAHDPELGRDVAIKMLRPSVDAGSPEQLAREARALARVSDPNVVTIFEVGTDEGQLFFAMELVRGETLGAWCSAQREGADMRTWSRAVLHAFCLAGKGLAAIHAARIVHLDFKPSNVLVGEDGRVRVTDFGIVRIADAQMDVETTRDSVETVGRSSATRFGGTIAYMSPEQFLGSHVDLRSDVFSFCVSLYEALYGASPYPAKTLMEKLGTFANGDAVVPRGRGIPRRVAVALERGLKIDPAARWPTMAPLLAALQPPARPKVLIASALGLAIGGATVFSLSTAREEERPCRQAAELVATVWSPERATAIRDGFLRTGVPYASQAAFSAVARLQAYADEWTAAHTEACVATRVHGHQSEAMLARRMECLDARLVELGAVVGAFEAAEAPTLENASDATGMLGSIATCADLEALAQAVPLPTDPELRARAEALRREIAETRARAPADGTARAAERARANVEDARVLGHPPLHLAALVEVSVYEADVLELEAAESAAREALGMLARLRDDVLEAAAWRTLMRVQVERGEARLAVELLPALDIAAARSGLPQVIARSHVTAAYTLQESGDLDGAQERLDAAETAFADLGEPVEFVRVLMRSGDLARRRGDVPRARELDVYASLLVLAAEGPEHPWLGNALENLAVDEAVLGHPDRALALLELAHGIALPLIAEDGLQMAQLHTNLGNVLWRAGRIADAREQLMLAELIVKERVGPDSIFAATVQLSLSGVERDDGDLVAAENHALASLESITAIVGREDTRAAAALEALGAVDLAREQWIAAERRYGEALAIRERAHSDEIDTSLLGLARAESATGRNESARPRLLRVVDRAIASGEPWRGNRLDAEIELAQLELDGGQRAAGRARLETVRIRAREHGRVVYERRAADALAAAAR